MNHPRFNLGIIPCFLFLSIFLTGCDKGMTPDPPAIPIEIVCPNDVKIVLFNPSISLDSIDLPLPSATTECMEGDLSYSHNLPTEIVEGIYQVNFTVTNGCGGTSTCSFMLTAEDYKRKMEVVCPKDIKIVLFNPSILLDSIDLPFPVVTTECMEGNLTFSHNLPSELQEGAYQVNYTVTNGCGGTSTCSFMLITEDYRRRYLGNYIGIERYSTNQILISETTREVEVTMGPDDDDLIVDGDEVTIDTTGVFPYPSCCGYRWYWLKFWSDSVSINKITGSISVSSLRSFKGKRK